MAVPSRGGCLRDHPANHCWEVVVNLGCKQFLGFGLVTTWHTLKQDIINHVQKCQKVVYLSCWWVLSCVLVEGGDTE